MFGFLKHIVNAVLSSPRAQEELGKVVGDQDTLEEARDWGLENLLRALRDDQAQPAAVRDAAGQLLRALGWDA